MDCRHSTPVSPKGFIYGVNGRQEHQTGASKLAPETYNGAQEDLGHATS